MTVATSPAVQTKPQAFTYVSRSTPPPAAVSGPTRVTSIDALRGFDMFWIMGPEIGHALVLGFAALILGGKEYVPQWLRYNLDHPRWTGFSAWDMIMPLFLFIVGVAMPFSIGRRLEQGDGRGAIYFKALRRVMLLWILGMISQGNLLDFRLDRLRLYSNTLQSIAAGYLIATIVLVELRNWRWQIGVTAGLLVLYWACMAFIPFHGHRGEYTEQGNLGILLDKAILNGWTYNWIVGGAIAAAVAIMIITVGTWCTSSARLSQKIIGAAVVAGLVVWMLIAAFGVDRNLVFDFQDRTTYAWILGSISFGATVMMGVLAGQLLKSSLAGWTKVGILLAAGAGCLALGWGWNMIPTPMGMPIIKHIWTSSMALWAGGWSLLLLALFYAVIDVVGLRAWSFVFVVIGANAILAYMANNLFNIRGIGARLFGGLTKHFGQGADFGLTLLTFALMWAGMWFLYRKRVFLRV